MKRFLIAIRLIGIYIWVSITIMVMPYFRVFETSLYPFESVLHTMKSMVLNNDSSVVQYFAAQDVSYARFYTTIIYILYVLSPLFTLGISISFFEKKINTILYHLSSLFRRSVIFTEFNEKTIYLGEFIREKDRKAVIVYLKSGKDAIDYHIIKQMNALVFDGHIDQLRHSLSKNRSAYLLSNDELKNIKDVMSLIDIHRKKWLFNDVHLVYRGEAPKVILEPRYGKMNIHWIEEEMLLVEDLLVKSPLYEAVNDNDELNVMIIGLGKVGREVLKQVASQSFINLHTKVNITAMDLHANHVKAQIKHEAPLAFKGLTIDFFDVDVTTFAFNESIANMKHRPTYVVICLYQQQLSIETAIYLRRHYENRTKSDPVKIHVAIDNETTETLILKNLKETYNYIDDVRSFKIQSFGIYKENYKRYIYEDLRNRVLCYLTHGLYTYSEEELRKKSHEDIKELSSKLDMKNTRAFVTHLPTKLNLLHFTICFVDEIQTHFDQVLIQLSEAVEKHKENLAKLDGHRWNAFRKFDGFTPLPIEEIREDHYQIFMKKMHARIDLEDSKKLAIAIGYDEDFFIQKDIEAIRNIPIILKLYNEKIKSFDANAKYIMIKYVGEIIE